MTIKQLFNRVPFDKLVPYLLPLIDNKRVRLNSFRSAYDWIMSYEPIEGRCNIVWIRSRRSGSKKLDIRFLDGDPWPCSLAKEIVFVGKRTVPLACVAANCLWEMTFYGYSEVEITGQGDELGWYEEPRGPVYDSYMQLIQQISQNSSLSGSLSTDLSHSQELQLEELRNQSKRETLVLRMQQAFPAEELQFLMTMDYGEGHFYTSTVASGDERLPYILKLMEYQRLDTAGYDGAFFWLIVPGNFPWPEEPWLAFQQELNKRLGLPIRYGLVKKEASYEEIGGWLLLYKR